MALDPIIILRSIPFRALEDIGMLLQFLKGSFVFIVEGERLLVSWRCGVGSYSGNGGRVEGMGDEVPLLFDEMHDAFKIHESAAGGFA